MKKASTVLTAVALVQFTGIGFAQPPGQAEREKQDHRDSDDHAGLYGTSEVIGAR